MLIILIFFEINFIYSLALTLTIVDTLFVSIGEYPEYLNSGINYPECGLKYVSTLHEVHFNKKCFKNDYLNKTYVDIGKIRTYDSVEQRVVFGRDASIGEAPWAVYLSYKTGPHEHKFCSGVLITFEWILTAAHCYDNSPRTAVIANAGSNERKGLEQINLDKSKWFRHPDYFKGSVRKSDIRFDVSLVKLQRKFTHIRDEDKYLINTICLPERYQINFKGDKASFFGYGLINDDGRISKYLQRAELQLLRFGECIVLLICANYSGFVPRTCFGDSGGGLVQFADKYESRAILIGSLVGGIPNDSGCSERIEKDFFITISFYIDWILETIQNN